jgi:nitrite reductase (NADH) small subunit
MASSINRLDADTDVPERAFDEEACTVACPWHLWEWDLETGTHGASGQRIGTFDTEVANRSVFVRI